jgi:hypothetical protein
VDNQVAFYKWLANEWHDNFRPCMGATQWSKPFQDCLYTVRKENPMSSDDDDAFRLCIMVTDGQPYNDGFDWKAATKEVKTAGVQTVGVFLQTGRNYESDANHVYCISSCLDQSDYGKTLPGDDRYDFNVCETYMSADASRAKNMRDACKFYIDGMSEPATTLTRSSPKSAPS